jgi:hypothetical protein
MRPLQWPSVAVCLLGASLGAPGRLPAQVFQVQGGGSSLFAGYGGLVNIWGNGYEASLGIGYLDGLKVGASARRLLGGRDTLRVGNDLLPFLLDTDVFGTGGTIFAQGAALQRRRGRTQLWAFAGASATSLSGSLFTAQRPGRALAYVRTRYDVSRTVALSAHAVATDRQTLLGSVAWEPTLGAQASATLGVGNNSPYGALAYERSSPRLDVKATLAGIGREFRRASAPMPMQSELERENVMVTWKPRDGWSLGVGRQHFRQDSVFEGIAPRATLNQITGSARVFGTSLTGGWLVSESGPNENVSSYLSLRDDLTDWLQSEFYLLNVWQPTALRTTTPVLLLRERLSSQLSLVQVGSRDQGRTALSFGGTVSSGLSSLSLEYQVAHSPYLTANPFVQTWGVNARLHLIGMTLSLGSFITPNGRVHYSGQGSTFLYRGMNGTRAGGGQAIPRFDRYIVTGRVVDEDGEPVEGASLEVGSERVYTNSRGEFFLRHRAPKALALRIVLDDFLLPGEFEVREAPAEVIPAREASARAVTIVLRRVGQSRSA